MITIKYMNKSYNKKTVLKDINASFVDGKVYGIVGLNGAGKTTFFNCLSGLIDFEGTITHDTLSPLKNHLGYVPTEPYFFPRTKGIEYLHFIQHAKGADAIAAALPAMFELPLDEYIDHYSTGMKRKIAFTGAMVGDAAIYILDEPFNGVDIKSNLVLKRKILELKEHQKTIFISSHIVSSLTELCDEVHLLKDGKFVLRYMPEQFDQIENDLMEL
ncbi:MAG: ATP-binding cassette domain-containing protein [Flavipsychrobacter sp.]|nr:ATP-binding cassette domain-containing protein [Flavipsychrobacter sp.]